nr:unnamed protein product [Spirometra erinaceieuropaei]
MSSCARPPLIFDVQIAKTLATEEHAPKRDMNKDDAIDSIRPNQSEVFPKNEPESNENGWATSGDDRQPSPSSESPSFSNITEFINHPSAALSNLPKGESNTSNSLSVSVGPSSTGAPMEVEAAGIQYTHCKAEEPACKKSAEDPVDNLHLCE